MLSRQLSQSYDRHPGNRCIFVCVYLNEDQKKKSLCFYLGRVPTGHLEFTSSRALIAAVLVGWTSNAHRCLGAAQGVVGAARSCHEVSGRVLLGVVPFSYHGKPQGNASAPRNGRAGRELGRAPWIAESSH